MARPPRELPLLSVVLRHEADVVLARQRARLMAELLGSSPVDQTRVATAVSEVARNALEHGGGGRAEYNLLNTHPAFLVVRVEDSGPGLDGLPADIGTDVQLGPGSGLSLTRRLVDELDVESPVAGGARITLRKRLPARAAPYSAAELRALVDELARRPPESLLEELQLQHQELLAVLADLTNRQEALAAANQELVETNRGVMALYDEVTRELEETNRGVVALYAQLDDQAQRLREADAAKDRFISYLSHEFRTPLHAMTALSRLLLDRTDGPLTPEQERQVQLLGSSADDLLGMVNDILDLAKIQAGKLEVVEREIAIADVLAPLRVLFRPLAAEAGLALVLDEEAGLPPIVTDPQKVAQILRNLIGNAIKFTERGEVRVIARRDGPVTLLFAVSDTGVGIPAAAQQRIFQEYEQVGPRPGQRTRGTGLGLPLSRRLAELLGGTLTVTSETGKGSTFTVRLPLRGAAATAQPPRREEDARGEDGMASRAVAAPPAPARLAVVLDDDASARYLLERPLAAAGWQVALAASGDEALALLAQAPTQLLVLDLGLPGMSGYEVLKRVRGEKGWRDLAVVVCTAAELAPEQLAMLERSTEAIVFKSEQRYEDRVAKIAEELPRPGPATSSPAGEPGADRGQESGR
jgi:signal transduction histidine kinase/CheY-like chemotaxis protein